MTEVDDKDQDLKNRHRAADGSDYVMSDSLNDEDFEEARDSETEAMAKSERETILQRLKDEAVFNKKKIKSQEDDIKRLTNEAEAYKDRLIRLKAEYDNYRTRTEKEKSEMLAAGTSKAIKSIVPVMDNLERALQTEATDPEGMKEGVMLTLDQFAQALAKLGVEEIPTHEGFDPTFHEAIMHEVDPEQNANQISEVYLKGYKIGEKVIRHSVVKVVN